MHKGSAVYGHLFSIAMSMLMVVNVQMPHCYALMESNNNTLELGFHLFTIQYKGTRLILV